MKYFGLHLDKAVKGYFTLFNILLKHTQTVNLVSVCLSHTFPHTQGQLTGFCERRYQVYRLGGL